MQLITWERDLSFKHKIISLLPRYLMVVGIAANITLVAGLLGLYIFIDQPLGNFLEKVGNYLAHQRKGTEQQVGKLLLKSGLAEDWSQSADQNENRKNSNKSPNPLILAANPETQYSYQHFDQQGKPLESETGPFLPPLDRRAIGVSTPKELLKAISNAQPGDVITLAPGKYRLQRRSISVGRRGTADKPIYVRSAKLGSVILEMDSLEGFHIKAPFWVFENLHILGVCSNDSRCEHAFHVVGNGSSFTLRNSKLVDFNAHIKVNGLTREKIQYFPDNGLLEYNTFVNSKGRKTRGSVTLLNIDSVDNWVVRGNFVADFSKLGSDKISYGAFMKGNGNNGVFERNLIVCEHLLPADSGVRLGLSFGGGGTGAKFCRNHDCSTEHRNGIIRNNIILNCSRDVGIYLNRAANTKIYNNLLYNNLGIDVRRSTSSATIINNIISGRIKDRNEGTHTASNNLIDRACIGKKRDKCALNKLYAAPEDVDFRLLSIAQSILGAGLPGIVNNDFCGNPRNSNTDLGPFQYSQGLDCLQPKHPD